VNGAGEKMPVKPKRRSVAAALAAGKFGEAGEINPPSGDEGVLPLLQVEKGHDACDEIKINLPPSIVAIRSPENQDSAPMETVKEEQHTDKPAHQSNETDKGTQNNKLISITGSTLGTLSRQNSERERVKNVPSSPRAGRLERGQSQATRRNRTFRASDGEFDILFDILEQVRRSRRLTRSQANRVETSTIIRAALRHVAKAPVDAILDEIIEKEDFSG
jgi:hypothetical protein